VGIAKFVPRPRAGGSAGAGNPACQLRQQGDAMDTSLWLVVAMASWVVASIPAGLLVAQALVRWSRPRA